MSPSGKAPDFDSGIRRFKSCHPSQQLRGSISLSYDPLAQLAEQLPFKQWVWSSNLQRVTKKEDTPSGYPLFSCPRDSKITNAARMSAAGEGLTEPHYNFCQRQNCKRICSGSHPVRDNPAGHTPTAPSGRGLSAEQADWGREQAVTCQMVRSIRPIPMSVLPPLSLRPRLRSATSLRLRCPAAAAPDKAGLHLADRGAHCALASSATGSAKAHGPEGGFGAPLLFYFLCIKFPRLANNTFVKGGISQ